MATHRHAQSHLNTHSARSTTEVGVGGVGREGVEEIARLRAREQKLKRKRVLQSLNEDSKKELEELREVVEQLVETGASLLSLSEGTNEWVVW